MIDSERNRYEIVREGSKIINLIDAGREKLKLPRAEIRNSELLEERTGENPKKEILLLKERFD